MEQDDKSQYLSIKDISKMCNISTRTVRYYDCIGLFKADYVDPFTRYRYYHPDKYEKLSTILELRQLNFSLDEIKEFFTNRNISKSSDLLQKHYDLMMKEIKQKMTLAEVVKEKLDFVEHIKAGDIEEGAYTIRERDERYAIVYTGTKDLSYALTHLEQHLGGAAPVFASDRVGFFSKHNEDKLEFVCKQENWKPMIFCERSICENKHFQIIPKGKYLCTYIRNCSKPRQPVIRAALEYAQANGYEFEGIVVQSMKIDVTITDIMDETLVEIELKIKD